MLCTDKVALVTGAAGHGMGRSSALTLAREGAAVIVNYHTSQAAAAEIVTHITQQGGRALAVPGDIFTPDGCQTLVQAALDAFGRIDICIVGPGAGWHPEPPDALDSAAALADLHQEVAPLYYLLPLLLPGMYARHWGRIIGLALHPTRLPPAYAYNAGKAARAHAFLLAADAAQPHGVTVNLIAPGPVAPLDSLDAAVAQCTHGPAWQQRAGVSPQDIAEGVAFLCSDAVRWITGCVLPYFA